MVDSNKMIKELKKGNQSSLHVIYKQYKNEFVKWSYSEFNLPSEEAIEAFQYAIVTFYENVLNGKLELLSSSIKTYLFAVGKNKAMEYHRMINKMKSLDYAAHLTNDQSKTEEEIVENENRQLKVEASVIKLGLPCSEILISYYYHKKSLTEIATKMNYKNTESLKSQKFKCMERLKGIYFNK